MASGKSSPQLGRAGLKATLKVILLVLCPVIILPLGLGVGVWLPDVVFAPKTTLAYTNFPSGYAFRVIQYWNRVDFYSTELHIVFPDGSKVQRTLDGDDNKAWHVPMSIDESNRVIYVTLSGRRKRKVNY